MPRKQFKIDLNDAAHASIEFISDFAPGDNDGEFTFVFTDSALPPVAVTATVSEQSEYPTDHDYIIWASNDNTPPEIASKLEHASLSTHGKTISQLLSFISTTLSKPSSPASEDEDELEEEDPDDLDADDEIYADDVFSQSAASIPPRHTLSASASATRVPRSRIRSDLSLAKAAGFKIAHFDYLLEGSKCVVSVSISARKLGISEEAMQAWRIERNDYIILLIQYGEGYRTKEQLGSLDAATVRTSLEMRVGASKNYKPTAQQVRDAFASSSSREAKKEVEVPFRETFISKPLNNLLNERLVALVRLRDSGMTWTGAEDFYRNGQGMTMGSNFASSEHFINEQPSGYPPVVDADHLADGTEHSFPLAAMQFTLRHFVRCTEFCLVCHKKLDTLVEALKPYVCDSPLCLYQYMTLGFGPSIEHEVMTQGSVVDLLVSFCYASAQSGRLSDFPNGLALSVPSSIVTAIQDQVHGYGRRWPNQDVNPPSTLSSTRVSDARLKARFDASKQEILFDNAGSNPTCPLRTGDWVSLELSAMPGSTVNCRIVETSLYPTVSTGPLVGANAQNTDFCGGGKWHEIFIEKYSINFDELQDSEKRGVVCGLISLLPSVKQMQKYLADQSTPHLAKWIDRISPAAFAVLRWILASNRSCILEVDPHKAVHGMAGWMQFRFAMGAPDKEHRFLTAVKETKDRLNLKFPTMYAWHGSMLPNWHSIIREGLHFKDTINGRAYGNGVYHSPHCATSLGYSGVSYAPSTSSPYAWSNSDLKISSAIALNEVVNAPTEFVSLTPHYVVAQLDWIQTRYLFVKCTRTDGANFPEFDKMPEDKLIQDPARIPIGANGSQIIIPASTSKATKRKLMNHTSPGPKNNKRSKTTSRIQKMVSSVKSTASNLIDLTHSEDEEVEPIYEDSEDALSVATDAEDLAVFEDPELLELAIRKGPSKNDFVPGTLDHDTLPKLPMPKYANPGATSRLQKDLKALLDIQNKTPLKELGWYIDPEKVDNIYQWIVELHSFHMFNEKNKELPLAVDMEKHGVKSIVLELRFPGSYPMSPPFIRVVRPRFLPFLSGGGGHVTAGGAMCHMLLTSDGWMPSQGIDSVLLQIRMAIASTDPKPARLQVYGKDIQSVNNSYGSGEAVEAYKRACITHGWTIPADFDQTTAVGQ